MVLAVILAVTITAMGGGKPSALEMKKCNGPIKDDADTTTKLKYAACIRYNIGKRKTWEKANKAYYKSSKALKKATKEGLAKFSDEIEIEKKDVAKDSELKAAITKLEEQDCSVINKGFSEAACNDVEGCKVSDGKCVEKALPK